MNKMREYERGREDGLTLALRIVKDGGVPALEKEIRFRGVTGIHTSLACKDLDKASQQIKDITRDCFIILSVAALHDAFGFGETRVQRWMDKFNQGADYLDNGFAEWADYIREIKEQLNITLDIRDGSRPLEEKGGKTSMIEIMSMEPSLMDKIRQISEHYDKYTQTRKAREECQELMDELFKPKIINGNYVLPDNTWSEVADVMIMCIQIAMQHEKEDKVREWINYKVDRQLRRIENENPDSDPEWKRNLMDRFTEAK